MPIHLNLLAEDQAAEDLRRRDPTKRALWVGGLLLSVMLVWAAWLQARTMVALGALGKVEKQINIRTNEFQQVLDFQNKTGDATVKLLKLHQLATNRFLNGTLLNALQQTTVDNVQLLRLKVDQNYVFTDEIKAKPSGSGRTLPPKPATCTERITLTLEGKDFSPNPEKSDAVDRFKLKIADHPYFQATLGRTNEVRLIALSPPQNLPDSRPFVQFTLECRFPENTR